MLYTILIIIIIIVKIITKINKMLKLTFKIIFWGPQQLIVPLSFWSSVRIWYNIYIYIIGEVERSLNYNSKLEFQFCAMCNKLFILKEFYFLILESNMDHIINIHPSELLSTKTKKSRINEL